MHAAFNSLQEISVVTMDVLLREGDKRFECGSESMLNAFVMTGGVLL